ncbi:MAG TPA: XdhC family protein [Candidatus Limnocylindria bacterium]|nr:XdhC family protein [Candidatus Limnocylindria bacterium]
MTDEALAALRDWQAQGTAVALATVTRVTGSAPRQPGSKLAISADRRIAGSVSGGCVEGDVIEQAMAVLRDGAARLVHYGISDEMGMSVGLMCGGEIDVVIEPVDEALVGFAIAAEHGQVLERALPLTEFTDRVAPPPRLWVVGAGHVAEHVVAMGSRAGFSPVVIDPRRLFAQQDRFADADVRVVWPDVAFSEVRLGASDYIVVLSHDPKLDEPALLAALGGEPAYVGAIGSKKAQADRRERLLAAGISEEQLARLHAPIGLDLGGREPGEIAVAIVAELVSVRHRAR